MGITATATLAPAGLPDGPRLPSVLQALFWVYRPVAWMDRLGQRYSGAFTLHLPGSQAVFITDPSMIEEVFSLDNQAAAAGKANALLRPMVGSHSLLLLDGARHMRERKVMMPPFHGERMRAYTQTMESVAAESLTTWPLQKPFRLQARFQEVTLEVIFRVVLGVEREEEAKELRAALKELMDFSVNPSLLLFMRRDGTVRADRLQQALGFLSPRNAFVALQEKTDRLLYAELTRRRREPTGREDILSLLLAARHEDGSPMTDLELRDELITLLVAGHETTATALTWTVAELVQHPDVLERVLQELVQEVGEGPIQAGQLQKLRYLDAVISETLRLRPVIPIVARILERPLKLGSHELPPETMVCPCIYLTHRRPDLYPEPERFLPERFLTHPPSPFAYFPFGGGTRRCLGRAFALFEMKVVLAHLLPRVQVELVKGYRPRLVRRSITFAPHDGLPVIARRRSPTSASRPSAA